MTSRYAVRLLEPEDAAACDAVVESLPYFFGKAEGVAECAAAVRSQRGLVAVAASGRLAGFLTHSSHHTGSTEITWMAVHQHDRRSGVGRLLLDALDGQVSQEGVVMMFVITLGPSVPEPDVVDGYGGTRAFYEATGFVALKELDAWGPDSPGIILARATKAGRALHRTRE